MPSLLQTWALPIAVVAIANIAGTWFKLVDQTVPEPYLDEVFHVPQAQRYCKGDYTWDPKITTPPGLYLISRLLEPITGGCDTSSLRALNAGAICLICVLAYDTLARQSRVLDKKAAAKEQTALLNAHTALNISLFPPLFFFSGLYYTDIVSTLLVFPAYNTFLRKAPAGWQIWEDVLYILVGIVALSMRQTNVFWVAVFPAGLAIVNALKEASVAPSIHRQMTASEIVRSSWTEGTVYDCAIQDASLADCVLFACSTAIAALSKPFLVARVIARYIVLLGLFAVFVAWNGGVVLGDKSNHVATIHLPQMLYIWPYIIFFSFPMVLPTIIGPIVRQLPYIPLRKSIESHLSGQSPVSAPGVSTSVLFLVISTAAVHFNTIVHPFTLADNRHYVFYVFRILRRHPAIKFLAIPLYFASAWMAIQTVGLTQNDSTTKRSSNKQKMAKSEATHQPRQLSFILVWLVTTTLSVVSAPLVEPRYYIISYIVWRLYIPSLAASHSEARSDGKAPYDLRLVLETMWLLVVNAITGYLFLYRGFTWLSEPSNVQRFLW